MGIAYNSVVNRGGIDISNPSGINSCAEGFTYFCSSSLFNAGTYNLEDNTYVNGQEILEGQVNILDVKSKKLYVAPALGRGAWENLTFLDTKTTDKVAVLLCDDTSESPMYLYVWYKK